MPLKMSAGGDEEEAMVLMGDPMTDGWVLLCGRDLELGKVQSVWGLGSSALILHILYLHPNGPRGGRRADRPLLVVLESSELCMGR